MVQKCASIRYEKKYVLIVKVIKYVLINYEEVAAKSVMALKFVSMAIINIIVFLAAESMCASTKSCNINVLIVRDDLLVSMVNEKQPVQIVMEVIFVPMNSKRINVSNVIQKLPVNTVNPSPSLVHVGHLTVFVVTVY